MSETTELVQSTVQKVMERVDLLAGKLGIAAGQIWKYTLTAHIVNARRELAKAAALLLLPVVFWGWGLHVATMNLPHDKHGELQQEFLTQPCDQIAMVNGKQEIVHTMCQSMQNKHVEVQGDLSGIAWALIVSAIIAAIAGTIIVCEAVAGVIDAIAASKTPEYDSYQDLINDWRD